MRRRTRCSVTTAQVFIFWKRRSNICIFYKSEEKRSKLRSVKVHVAGLFLDILSSQYVLMENSGSGGGSGGGGIDQLHSERAA